MSRWGTRKNSGRKMGTGNKIKVNWSIREDIVKHLKELSKKDNVSMSSIVEKALTNYFDEDKISMPDMIINRIIGGLKW